MSFVNMRGGFSDRYGIKSISNDMQLETFDKRTRIQLQNMINNFYYEIYGENIRFPETNENIQKFYKYLLGTVFSEPVDNRNIYGDTEIFRKIDYTFEHGDYDDILTLIEAIISYWHIHLINISVQDLSRQNNEKNIFEKANFVFEREYLGYRFISGKICPISDTYEVNTIKESLNNPYKAVSDHIEKANILLSDREKPDYENSIKESISAVEALCVIITGAHGNDATLGKMLKKLEGNGIVIHNAMKSSFNSLYGFTNDANGIRHAGDIGGPSSTFEEAKYMLVSCSAFVNYLIAIMSD